MISCPALAAVVVVVVLLAAASAATAASSSAAVAVAAAASTSSTDISAQSETPEQAGSAGAAALAAIASASAATPQEVAAAAAAAAVAPKTAKVSSEQERPPLQAATSRANLGPNTRVYTNQFVIQVRGGEEEARKVAERHGFVYLNHILADYYHLEHRRLSKRSLSPTQDALNISIESEPQVLLLERQVLKRRVKRDFLDLGPPPAHLQPQVQVGNQQQAMHHHQQHHHLHNHQLVRPPNQRVSSGAHQLLRPARPPNQAPSRTQSGQSGLSGQARPAELLEPSASGASIMYSAAVAAAALNAASSRPLRPNNMTQLASGANLAPPPPLLANLSRLSSAAPNEAAHRAAPFNDPSWPLMWYLDGGAKNGFDLNVMAAWKMGYTGKGIVITILDDGLEKDHPDLQANYDPLASFDINGDDADPMPRYDVNDSNRHGTRCAGEVAAVPDNNICSIGIAYNSRVGGVRMLDGDVTDAVEARSLRLNNQHIHIYSASWGPDDNGKTVDGPGEMATRAFIEGVTNGRQGLGSIFVFASGNGGREHDNCNCDGYTNSIWTLSISSATENGYVPWYIEACSSTLATTYSSGSYEERQIATTDLHHSCTSSHTGTSASAPLAAGICALVLESNPRLTWRDMQHIVVRTAKPANLVAKDWRTNAMGRNVSHAFGYGLMDAAAMIHLARKWATVPVQYTCEVRSPQMEKFIPSKGYIELKLRAECANVRHLEHVQSKVTLTSQRRGDLHIYLVSPLGTRSTLLAQRPNDQAEQGFRNWPFMTVHSWGESPNGIWTLEVHNDGKPQNRAYLKEWTLILYGTYEDPNKHLDGSTPPPPPPEPPYPAHIASAGVRVQPSAGSTGGSSPVNQPSPATTSSPPPPLPVTTTTTTAATVTLKAPVSAPPPPLPSLPGNSFEVGVAESGRPGGSGARPHSGFGQSQAPQSPPPPPPPERPASEAATTRLPVPPAIISTTTPSYVTTFKTLVSTTTQSSSSVAANVQPPHVVISQQQQQIPQVPQQHRPPAITTTTTGSPLPTSSTGEPTKADFEVVSAPGSTSPPPPPPANDQRQPVMTSTASPPMKPPVSADLPSLSTPQQPPSELDNNQIASVISKDYRSSGDVSFSSSSSSSQLKPSSTNAKGQNSATELTAPNTILLFAITTCLILQQLVQLSHININIKLLHHRRKLTCLPAT